MKTLINRHATGATTSPMVYAALNGPMAHIYLRNQNGWAAQPDQNEL